MATSTNTNYTKKQLSYAYHGHTTGIKSEKRS